MKVWLSAGEGAKILHVTRPTFKKIVDQCGIRRQILPGLGLVRYSEEDCIRVARESIVEPKRSATDPVAPAIPDQVTSSMAGVGRRGAGSGPRLIRQESAEAAPATTHTKKAGVHTR